MSRARATCKVSIRGSFDVHWVDYLGDVLLCADVADGSIRTTTLFAKPPDLAAFIGLLNVLADFGFVVVACEYRQPEIIQQAATSRASTASCVDDARGVGIGRG